MASLSNWFLLNNSLADQHHSLQSVVAARGHDGSLAILQAGAGGSVEERRRPCFPLGDQLTPNFLHLNGTEGELLPTLQDWLGRSVLNVEAELEDNGWITFSVDCDFVSTDEWLTLGRQFDLIYESYSTSLRMGELVVVRSGELVRHFLHHESEDGDERVNVGKLTLEADKSIETWADVWEFVDEGRWLSET